MKWLEQLLLALVNEDIEQIISLYDSIPEFENLEDLKQAEALIEQAISMLENEKHKTNEALKRIEVVKKYGANTVGHPSINRLSKAIY